MSDTPTSHDDPVLNPFGAPEASSPPPPQELDDSLRTGPPFESVGGLQGWCLTLVMVVFRPHRLFRESRPVVNDWLALLFALIVCLSGGLVTLGLAVQRELPPASNRQYLVLVAWLFAFLIAFAIGIVVVAGIYHQILRYLAGATGPFSSTFRAVCYSQACQVWWLSPEFPYLLYGISQVISLMFAFQHLHRMRRSAALSAVLAPLALFLIAGVGNVIYHVLLARGVLS